MRLFRLKTGKVGRVCPQRAGRTHGQNTQRRAGDRRALPPPMPRVLELRSSSSAFAKRSAALHDSLQLFENGRKFSFGLGGALAVKRFQTDGPHFCLKFVAEYRAIGSAAIQNRTAVL